MTEFDLSTREGRWKHFGSVDPIKGTKPTTKNEMTDLQSTHKDFLFEIEEVGIKNLVYPVLVDQYQTAGTFSFSTSLTKDEKGINMSRIIESVEKHYDNGIELEFNTLYQVLQRPDEKRVTERAYENPRFVEDLIRLIAADLVEFDWLDGFDIECRNEESIHQHDAFAKLKYRK
ncbi:GTP cyclohydrolase, FolE2/MptA family [Staphylococcus aureus]